MRVLSTARLFFALLIVGSTVFYLTLHNGIPMTHRSEPTPLIAPPLKVNVVQTNPQPDKRKQTRIPLIHNDKCPLDIDFNSYVQRRLARRLLSPPSPRFWQSNANDKLGAYVIAKHMGIRVPEIYFCTAQGPDDLKHFTPPLKGGFVTKPTRGFFSKGVFLFPSGRFDSMEIMTGRHMTLKDVQKQYRRLEFKHIYAEEQVLGHIPNEPPFNYRFYMFNGRVGGVAVDAHEPYDSKDHCEVYMDEDWNPMIRVWPDKRDVEYDGPHAVCVTTKFGNAESRNLALDGHNATCLNPDQIIAETHQYHKGRPCKDFSKPRSWSQMVSIAKRLSQLVGIFMRIDLFENASGEVVLGEFTPYTNAGKRHCFVKQNIETGCVDPCHLGRLWKAANGGEYNDGEGGPITEAPKYMVGWENKSAEEKCKVVMSLSSGSTMQ